MYDYIVQSTQTLKSKCSLTSCTKLDSHGYKHDICIIQIQQISL